MRLLRTFRTPNPAVINYCISRGVQRLAADPQLFKSSISFFNTCSRLRTLKSQSPNSHVQSLADLLVAVSSTALYRMTAVVHTSIARAAAAATVAQNIAASSHHDLKAFATRAGQKLRPRLADVGPCAQRRTNDRTIQSAARPRQHTPPLTVKPRSQKRASREGGGSGGRSGKQQALKQQHERGARMGGVGHALLRSRVVMVVFSRMAPATCSAPASSMWFPARNDEPTTEQSSQQQDRVSTRRRSSSSLAAKNAR